MNRKFLTMLAAICGAVLLVCVLFIPMAGKGEFSRNFIEGQALGVVFVLVGIFAALYAVLTFLGKHALLGVDADRGVSCAMMSFGVGAFLGLAVMIADTDGLKFGFWLYWIGCLAGFFFTLLASNPDLAKKLAAAAKANDEPPATPPSS
jgi:hypothetical protein